MAINFSTFGSTRIFRPDSSIERWIEGLAREHLLSKYKPGEYRGVKANEIIQHQFGFYEKLLKGCIPALTQRDAMEFLLHQYDEASKILHGNTIYDLQERADWSRLEPYFKRAIKFLVESICSGSTGTHLHVSEEQCLWAMNAGVACTETLALLSQESDLAFSILKDDFVARIPDKGPLSLLLGTEGSSAKILDEFRYRLQRDRNHRKEEVGWPAFDLHSQTHQEYLDEPFQKSFGRSYGDFIYAIMKTIDGCEPSLHPNSFPTLFISFHGLINEICKLGGFDRDTVEVILSGFTITPSKLKDEGRVIFKPKQIHRAFRRGFFLMPHETGPHLAFSREMARECYINLCNGVAYRKLPPEWCTAETEKALIILSEAAGKWFESKVCDVLLRLGIRGAKTKRRLTNGAKSISIPDSVGEIDFLGCHEEPGLVIVIEAKMVLMGADPVFWRDEIDEFTRGKRCYAEQLRRKLAWVRENVEDVAEILGCGKRPKIAGAIVTLYPTIASNYIKDLPCVSLTELALDFQKERCWPYAAF